MFARVPAFPEEYGPLKLYIYCAGFSILLPSVLSHFLNFSTRVMNEDYVENLRHRTSKYLAAMKALEEKADKIAELCDAQVGVICYPTDNLTPLFYGRPR